MSFENLKEVKCTLIYFWTNNSLAVNDSDFILNLVKNGFMVRKNNKITIILVTGRFDNIDSAVIISSVSNTMQICTPSGFVCLFYTADNSKVYVGETSIF